jgi:hypothetical protein
MEQDACTCERCIRVFQIGNRFFKIWKWVINNGSDLGFIFIIHVYK